MTINLGQSLTGIFNTFNPSKVTLIHKNLLAIRNSGSTLPSTLHLAVPRAITSFFAAPDPLEVRRQRTKHGYLRAKRIVV